jgi:riboflavin synthase
MFTGIVEGKGQVVGAKLQNGNMRLAVRLSGRRKTPRRGESISINGACLTVSSVRNGVVFFDVVGETLRRTNLGLLESGSSANYEMSMTSADLIGGHLVTGHIDGTGIVKDISPEGGSVRMKITVPARIGEMISEKGFVAVDGVSLTPARVTDREFTVYLIPETQRLTVFSARKKGDAVNIEVDLFAKYIKKFVDRYAGKAQAATLSAVEKRGKRAFKAH